MVKFSEPGKYVLNCFIVSTYYVVAFSFIGDGKQGTRRKAQTCRKSLINFIT